MDYFCVASKFYCHSASLLVQQQTTVTCVVEGWRLTVASMIVLKVHLQHEFSFFKLSHRGLLIYRTLDACWKEEWHRKVGTP